MHKNALAAQKKNSSSISPQAESVKHGSVFFWFLVENRQFWLSKQIILWKNDKIRQINKIATKGCESGKTESRKRQKMAQTEYKNKLQCKKNKLIMLAAKA